MSGGADTGEDGFLGDGVGVTEKGARGVINNSGEKRVFAGYDCAFGRGRLADIYVFNEEDGNKLMNELFLVDLGEDVYSFSNGIAGEHVAMHVNHSSVYIEPKSGDVVMEIASVSDDCRDAAREKVEGLVNI